MRPVLLMTENNHIDIVFDGPPSHESGRFVEVENAKRASIAAGEWIHRNDGYWVLRLTVDTFAAQLATAKADALREAADDMESIIASGDIAEVAAYVDGETGRQEAISARDSLYEEPAEFIRARAAALTTTAEKPEGEIS
jgi:hypothetical protein